MPRMRQGSSQLPCSGESPARSGRHNEIIMTDSLAIILTEAEKAQILIQTHELYEGAFLKFIASISILMVLAGAIIPFGGYLLMSYNLKKYKRKMRMLKHQQSELEQKLTFFRDDTLDKFEKARKEIENDSDVAITGLLGIQMYSRIEQQKDRGNVPTQEEVLMAINYLHSYVVRSLHIDLETSIYTLTLIKALYEFIEFPVDTQKLFRLVSKEQLTTMLQIAINHKEIEDYYYSSVVSFYDTFNSLKID